MTLHVRSATSADAPIIAEYNRLLALETEDKVLDPSVLAAGVAALLADVRKGRYFVAEEAGAVLGQTAVTYEWSDWRNGWVWWLQSVYVRKDARRRGIFEALYRHVEGAARAEGNVIGLRLYVERHNGAAQECYRRLGMTESPFLLLECWPLPPAAAAE